MSVGAVEERPPATAEDPGEVAFWEWSHAAAKGRRSDGGLHAARVRQVGRAFDWVAGAIGLADDGAGAAVLDVSAGLGVLGPMLRQHWPKLEYHATEQSAALVAELRATGQPHAAAVWRCEPEGDGRAPVRDLGAALRAAYFAGERLRAAYEVVLATFVLDCVRDPYAVLDNAWPLVAPGGALLVAVQRQFEHRVHRSPMDWSRLLGTVAQYAWPQVCFDDGHGGALVVALFRPPESGGEGDAETARRGDAETAETAGVGAAA